MQSSLSINRLFNTTVNLGAANAQMQNLSNLLVLGSSNVIDVVERMRTYLGLPAVATDFGTSSPEYLSAAAWFGQSPQPSSIQIGRWAKTAPAGVLKGALISAALQAIASWNAKTTPGFLFSIDGVPVALAPASFAAATNMNGIAALIQTAMQVSNAGSTCVWNANYSRFEFTSGTTGATSSVGFVSPSAAVGNAGFSANPANLDTLTLGGTAITFTTGTPVGNQVAIGASLAVTLASLAALINGSADVNLVKFSAVVNPAGTALYVTAITPGVGGNALTMAKTSTAITLSGATLAGATAQDISAMLLARATDSGAYVANGIAAESAAAAATLFDTTFGQKWYALMIPEGLDADHLAVAPLVEGMSNKHVYGFTTQEAGTLSSTSVTDLAYLLSQLKYLRTCYQYSSSSAYAVASLLGRILTTNYAANSSVITLMYKQEPGVVPESLNASQVAALEAKNCNVFLEYNNNTAIIEPGVVASGDFIDIVTGTDWLALAIQNDCYNLEYTSPTKIPQTDAGSHQFVTTIEAECSQGVANGLLAPGVWGNPGFGTLNEGDFLPKGFYVYATPMALQNPADRAVRKCPPLQVAVKLAGAIHTADVLINVNR